MQRRVLALYQQFRNRPMTLWSLVSANQRVYVLFLLSTGGIVAFAQLAFGALGSSIFGALVAGALVRDVGHLRRSVMAWPAIREVIDWNKVAELLNQEA